MALQPISVRRASRPSTRFTPLTVLLIVPRADTMAVPADHGALENFSTQFLDAVGSHAVRDRKELLCGIAMIEIHYVMREAITAVRTGNILSVAY